ncbi:hypothetical protein TWF225_009292 [Orbilia oligospora]|nr:hypothetical protein TWF225_009292 [Orbilia oligospora]KAF3269933.1 hypothetical protein TWF217_008276 [Orbilia oligospora]KAF3270393.1 hypothetical protein TWF128_004167 [Orbilia oligospora]KAF3298119.1 hypothetical protein TWF132_004260 [Orbilia oligospora]
MKENINQTPTIWALLIGVESYFQGKERPINYPRLKGCVRDVKAVEKYLRQVGVQNIKTLTASGDTDPIENWTELPVYENIERELHHITENARAADLVYIHYSGHGIRRNILGQEQGKNGDTITGTALALADVMIGGAYLTGYQLGAFVKKMVKYKGLRVTLVLDSCFSGQGLRSSKKYTLRTMAGQSDDSVLQSDLIADQTVASADIDSKLTKRKVHLKQSWLSNPSGCTVLTACQFDEAAGEDDFPGTDGAHGVLTYWMLKALTENPSIRRPTHAKIKAYVQSKISGMRPRLQQSPVLHGDGDHVFLGNEVVVERPACHVLGRYEDSIDLDVGKVHGVSVGAIYDVYPDTQNIETGTMPQLQAYVIDVSEDSAFRSTAALFAEDPKSLETFAGRGSRAVLRTWALSSDIYVSISPSEHIDEIHLEQFRTAIERTPGLYFHTDYLTDEPFFAVTVNNSNEFQISSMGKLIPRIPRLSVQNSRWVEKLAYILCHVARFQDLYNIPSGNIHRSLPPYWFSYAARAMGLEPIIELEGRYHVKGGTKLIISLKLNDTCPLEYVYVSFYSFSSDRGIQKVHPGPGQTATKLPRNRLERFGIIVDALKDGRDNLEETEDTIRAFICTREVSWEELTLPDLPMNGLSVPSGSMNGVTVVLQENHNAEIAQKISAGGDSTRKAKSLPLDERERLSILDLVIRTTH